jgi:monofunctional biosynthetic peptidoglycan transglycosylase
MGRKRHRKSLSRRIARLLFTVAAAWIVLSGAAVLALRAFDPPTTSVMLLEPGPWHAIDYRWVDRERIPLAMAQAAIAAEDQRFLDHAGIDVAALSDAVEDYRRGDGLRGASTITQQVAKNLFLWNGRSFVRKGLEAWFALLIDVAWPKERVLEVYLNVAELGTGVFGVEAAALRFYGVPAAELTASQSATLAAVLPSPKRMDAVAPSEYVDARRREILEQIRLLEQRGHYRGLEW